MRVSLAEITRWIRPRRATRCPVSLHLTTTVYILSEKREELNVHLIPEDDVNVRLCEFDFVPTRALYTRVYICTCITARVFVCSAQFSESLVRRRGLVAIDEAHRFVRAHSSATFEKVQRSSLLRRNPRRRPRRSTAVSRNRVWHSQAVCTAKGSNFGSRSRWFDSEWRMTSPPRAPRPHPRPLVYRHNTCTASSCRLPLALID